MNLATILVVILYSCIIRAVEIKNETHEDIETRKMIMDELKTWEDVPPNHNQVKIDYEKLKDKDVYNLTFGSIEGHVCKGVLVKEKINATTIDKSHIFACVDPKPKTVRRRLRAVLDVDKPMFEKNDTSTDLDKILRRGFRIPRPPKKPGPRPPQIPPKQQPPKKQPPRNDRPGGDADGPNGDDDGPTGDADGPSGDSGGPKINIGSLNIGVGNHGAQVANGGVEQTGHEDGTQETDGSVEQTTHDDGTQEADGSVEHKDEANV